MQSPSFSQLPILQSSSLFFGAAVATLLVVQAVLALTVGA